MNIRSNANPKYICDKCRKSIKHYPKKYGIFRDSAYHKDFDLCNSCNRELKKWLKEKPIPKKLSVADIINQFQEYKGDIKNG